MIIKPLNLRPPFRNPVHAVILTIAFKTLIECALPPAVRGGLYCSPRKYEFRGIRQRLVVFIDPLHAESGCAVRAEQRLAHRYDTIHHLVKPTRQAVSEVIHVRKKEFLVKQGSKSSHIYFITDGLFRCLCETNGNEDTFCFGVAGHPFLSVHTLAHDEPAAEK